MAARKDGVSRCHKATLNRAPISSKSCLVLLENKNMQSESEQVSHESEDAQKKQESWPVKNNGPNYQLRFILSGHLRSVSALKFSPDGSMLASAGELIFFFVSYSLNAHGGKLLTSRSSYGRFLPGSLFKHWRDIQKASRILHGLLTENI